MATKEEGYNGWKNYETWCVGLWIDNERPSYDRAREMAVNAKERAVDHERVIDGTWDAGRAATYILSDALEDWIKDMVPELESGMFQDLLNAAISEVDWHELAEHYLVD